MKTNTSLPALINDSQSLVSASGRFGHAIKIYDDGFGPLFLLCDSMGIQGIIRAQTWEDAYSIAEDEFFPEASETVDELRREYNFTRKTMKMVHPLYRITKTVNSGITRKARKSDYPLKDGQFAKWETVEKPCADENGWTENELFQEGFGFRPNGPNARDTLKHGIFSKDLNGESLSELTAETLAQWEIKLEIAENE